MALPERAVQERLMRRCLQLAENGSTGAAPNPMVGAVLAINDHVIAEGWHKQRGGPHAEVECLRSFGDGAVPKDAVLYVNLEPCAHFGATPPCVDLLIARGIKHLVVGTVDPDPRTHGRGITRARANGIHVEVDVAHEECRWLNRRFISSVEKQRPFIVLKWAQSGDGFIDGGPSDLRTVHRISTPATDVLVHRWRTEEQAILVGSRTVLHDDPSLTARHTDGRSPLRVVIDRTCIAPSASKVFTDGGATLLFTCNRREDIDVEQVILSISDDPLAAVLSELHHRSIRSVLVEGGAELHQHFIDRDLWDEVRIITSPVLIRQGTVAPRFHHASWRTTTSGADSIAWHIADRSGA